VIQTTPTPPQRPHRLAAVLASRDGLPARDALGGFGSEPAPQGREVLVTPPVCPVERKTQQTKAHPVCAIGGTFGTAQPRPVCLTGETFDDTAPFFVDWLTISQEHPAGGLPLVDAGAVWATDEAGEVKWRTVRRVVHEGSYETSLTVRCDGSRVELSGNVGRFARPDNVWGFGLVDCLARANEVLAHYGLPPFTPGQRMSRLARDGRVSVVWSGARISRIDLTANYETGSEANAHALLQYLATQHKSKQRGRTCGQGSTVDWGRGSRRQYWKAYIKFLEMLHHGCSNTQLIEYCRSVGLIRFEGTVRSNALTDIGAAYLGDYYSGWSMPQLIRLFDESAQILSRAEKVTDDLDSLPRHLRATARDYLAGMEMRSALKKSQFYVHRKALLPFGIDIAMPNITPFKPRVQVIELKAATRPDWYQLAA
jgi:II/X family phage/plasmid replication protein